MRMTFLVLLLFGHGTVAAQDIKPFKATYEVSRDGKVTGLQKTELTQTKDGLWRLTDVLEGTRGMASVLGFERHETTVFSWHNQQLTVLDHRMEQKAAFSKRRYRFTWDPDRQQYSGQHKDQPFTTTGPQQGVISAHLIPLSIGLAACQQLSEKKLTVLKSKKVRDYHFTIDLNSQPPQAHREFGPDSNRSSRSVLDSQRMCLPTAQTHIEEDQPAITSKLTHFTWL